ncbi:MAG: helix-turn-helix transcriptional regulator [Clostridiales bacterium]|nr:helix-turn-helix transcriptional regulator [Clostridiales bacterium]
METLQERLKERRRQLGLTLAQVAEEVGVKEATVQRYESGAIQNIKYRTILKLAQTLKCSPSYLLCWTDATCPSSQEDYNTITEHEQKVLDAYRNHPDLQASVDLLLKIH